MLTLRIVNKKGAVVLEKSDAESVAAEYGGRFHRGDIIEAECDGAPCFVRLGLDPAMGEHILYMKENTYRFPVPFFEQKLPYPKEAFRGVGHELKISLCRNGGEEGLLSCNPYDHGQNRALFPHAHATTETRNSPMFFARNAIDGNCRNTGHGGWPYESWGINKDPEAALTVEFGRVVEAVRVVLVTRADFPHDSWWEEATLRFSDGSLEHLKLRKTAEPQEFAISPRRTEWIRLERLVKTQSDDSPFPALTQIMVYGRDC